MVFTFRENALNLGIFTDATPPFSTQNSSLSFYHHYAVRGKLQIVEKNAAWENEQFTDSPRQHFVRTSVSPNSRKGWRNL